MSDEPVPHSEIILYQTEDGRTRIQCRFHEETLWLTQAQIAELLEVTPQNVTLHLKAIFAEGELAEVATCKDYLQVRLEGGREIARRLRHYRLEAIMAAFCYHAAPHYEKITANLHQSRNLPPCAISFSQADEWEVDLNLSIQCHSHA